MFFFHSIEGVVYYFILSQKSQMRLIAFDFFTFFLKNTTRVNRNVYKK